MKQVVRSLGKPGIRVILSIYGFQETPETITKLIGVKPDEIWRKGDVSTNSPQIRRKENAWTIIASMPKFSYNVEDYVKQLLLRLKPHSSAILGVLRKLQDAQMKIDIWLDLSPDVTAPALGFDREIIAALHEYGADVDIDISI